MPRQTIHVAVPLGVCFVQKRWEVEAAAQGLILALVLVAASRPFDLVGICSSLNSSFADVQAPRQVSKKCLSRVASPALVALLHYTLSKEGSNPMYVVGDRTLPVAQKPSELPALVRGFAVMAAQVHTVAVNGDRQTMIA